MNNATQAGTSHRHRQRVWCAGVSLKRLGAQVVLAALGLIQGVALAASSISGGVYINAPVVWSDTVSLQCATSTALGSCVKVSSTGQLVVTGALNFAASTDGRVQVQTSGAVSGVIALNTGSTSAGADDDSHVVGWLTKLGNDAFTYPVGDGTRLGQIGISAPAAATDSVRARFTYANPTTAFGTAKQSTLTVISTNQYWELAGVTHPVTATTGSNPSVTITLHWSSTNVLPSLSLLNLVVVGWDGAQWVNLGQGTVTGNATAGSVSASTAVNVNTYIAYAIATQRAAVDLTKSTLACTPTTSQVTGSTFTCTATARDVTNTIIEGAPLVLGSAVGSTPSATSCTTNASGQCSFTVTSTLAASYSVTAKSDSSDISGSPVTVQFTAPVVPTCTTSPNPAMGSANVTISCTGGTPGDTPSIPGATCTPSPIPANGQFTCSGTANAVGNNPVLTVTAPTGTSNTGSNPLVVDSTPPAAPVCTAAPNPSNQTAATVITCTNIASGDSVSIPGTTCLPATSTGGNVVCTSTSNNSVAANPTATAMDAAGNTSTKTVPYTIDTGAPVLSVTSAPGINSSNQASYAFSGTCSEDTLPVTVTIGSIAISPSPTCAAGAWSATADVRSLPQGSVLITASQVDAAGNVGSASASATKNLAGPVVAFTSTPVINVANKAAYTVSGTCSSTGGQVTFAMAGATPPSQTVSCTGGVFSATVDASAIADGTVPFSAAQTEAGNTTTTTGSAPKDTVNPSVVVTTAANINSANKTSYAASGTCSESGLAVVVRVGSVVVTPAPNCSATGTWSVSSVDVSALADGAVTVSAKQTRGSGNFAVGTLDVQKDAANPAAPSCTASPSPSNQTAATVITCSNIASGDSLSIPGTTCTPVPSTGGNVVCTSTSNTSVAADPVATVADPFNNSATSTVGYVVDTTAPTAPSSCTANPTSAGGTTPVQITCTVEAGTVNTLPGATCSTTGTTVTCNGTGASIASSPVLTSTDAAGNQSTSPTITYTQLGAPAAPVCTANPNPSNQTTAVVFTCTNIANGDSVSIPGTTCVPATSTGGNVVCTANSLTSVAAGPTATVNRPGGLSNTATPAYVIDTVKPAAPSCSASPTSGVASASITVTCNSVEVGSTNTMPGATCSPDPATSTSVTCTGTAGAMGSNPTLTTADKAGNSNTAQATFTLIGGASAANSSLACSPASVAAASSSTCTVTARDAGNSLVPGASFNLTSAAGSTVSAASCTTNASGVCSVTVTSNTAATYAVSAKLGGTDIGSSPANVTFTALAALATKSALSCSPASAGAGTNISCTITARDTYDNLASGGSFTMAASSGATVSATSCTTDTSGQCNFTVTSPTAGTYTVTTLFGGSTAITGSPASVSFTVPVVTIASPGGINSSNQASYSASGTCSENTANVTVAIGSIAISPKPVCTAGAWSVTGVDVSSLPQGSVLITASQVDAAGNVGSASASATKNLAGPVVAFTSTPVINVANKAAYTVSGTCSSTGGQVTFAMAGATPPSQTVSCTGGVFSATVDASAIADGTVPFSAAQTEAGNTTTTTGSVPKDTVNPSVVITSAADINSANKASYGVSGTCSENTRPVTVKIGSLSVSPAPTCTAGAWSVSAQDVSALAEGAVSISATQTRASGNTASDNRNVNKDTAAPAAPVCTATPNPATASQAVAISCTGVEAGSSVSIPGASCTVTGTTATCTGGTGATLGNNPPVRVTDSAGNVTGGVLPLQLSTTAGVNPPALPSCTASPNPASGSTAVTISCTGVGSGNTISIPGASCTVTGTTATCTGGTGATLGNNPTITVTDPTSGLKNSGVVPLATTGATPLPTCSASPNPAGPNTAVTISCTGVSSGTTLSVSGASCTVTGSTASCTGGTGTTLGNNPIITANNSTTGSTSGTVPLVIDSTAPAVPVCTATPNPATASQAVTISCTGVEAGSSVSIPGATCTVTGTTATCTGGTGATLGSNPSVSITDSTGNASNSVLPLQLSTALPSCTANPNPAGAGTPVTISCTGVPSGSTVSIAGTTCVATGATTVSCTGGTGLTLGNNPAITVSNPTSGSSSGNVPLTTTAPIRTHSGSVVGTGTGIATATLIGGGPGCGFEPSLTAFVTEPKPSPPGLVFPYGVFSFKASGCTPGSTVTVQVTWPGAIGGHAIWKYGPATPGAPVSTWFNTGLVASGSSTTHTVTDGGVGEGNLMIDGIIIDPIGPVRPAAVATDYAAIPTLGEWGKLLLALSLLLLGVLAVQRTERRVLANR